MVTHGSIEVLTKEYNCLVSSICSEYSRGLISAITSPFLTLWPVMTFIFRICPEIRKARFEISSATDMPAKSLSTEPSGWVAYTFTGRISCCAGCVPEWPQLCSDTRMPAVKMSLAFISDSLIWLTFS